MFSNWDTEESSMKSCYTKNVFKFIQADFVRHCCGAIANSLQNLDKFISFIIRFWESKAGELQSVEKRAIN